MVTTPCGPWSNNFDEIVYPNARFTCRTMGFLARSATGLMPCLATKTCGRAQTVWRFSKNISKPFEPCAECARVRAVRHNQATHPSQSFMLHCELTRCYAVDAIPISPYHRASSGQAPTRIGQWIEPGSKLLDRWRPTSLAGGLQSPNRWGRVSGNGTAYRCAEVFNWVSCYRFCTDR